MNNQLLLSYLKNKSNNLGNKTMAVLFFGFCKNVNLLLTAFWAQKNKSGKKKTTQKSHCNFTNFQQERNYSLRIPFKTLQTNTNQDKKHNSIKSIYKVSQCQQIFC